MPNQLLQDLLITIVKENNYIVTIIMNRQPDDPPNTDDPDHILYVQGYRHWPIPGTPPHTYPYTKPSFRQITISFPSPPHIYLWHTSISRFSRDAQLNLNDPNFTEQLLHTIQDFQHILEKK